jgi:hypothetical protein
MILDNDAKITRHNDNILIESQDDHDIHTYQIMHSPFRINYYINDTWVMEVNSKDLLYFETPHSIE